MDAEKLTARQRAAKAQNEKRRGGPMFGAIRMKSIQEKAKIDNAVFRHGGTRREALIEAFDLLDEKLG